MEEYKNINLQENNNFEKNNSLCHSEKRVFRVAIVEISVNFFRRGFHSLMMDEAFYM